MKKLLMILIGIIFLAGCGQTIVLMPDLNGSVGELYVTANTGESVTLNQANQALKDKERVVKLTDEEIQSTFKEALEAQPVPTARFILYFHRDSDTLTDASSTLFPGMMRAYAIRNSTDVSVIGHSDAMGDEAYNLKLSTRRAEKIKRLLIDSGMNADIIETISHGEKNPLIPTPDGKAEPKNRRVEVLIR